MKLMISTSKIKEQDMSAKVTVIAGKASKTKPAMATINVATAQKKTAAKITFKPTKEATLEKPKYEIRLNRMGKGFRMKNAAECIQSLKVFGFDPKDGKPIRDFVAGKTTAAQFKKAMGTKSYVHKEDGKALETVKMINAAKLPTSGKGKITRKMIDGVFEHYQSHPVIRPQDVKRLLAAVETYNTDGKVKPSALKSIRTLFARSKTNARNPKIKAMSTKFNAIIAILEKSGEVAATASNTKLSAKVRKSVDGDQHAIFGMFDGRTCVRGIEITPSFSRPLYYAITNGEVGRQLRGAKIKAEYKALGVTDDMIALIDQYASEEITPQKFARAFNAGKATTPSSKPKTQAAIPAGAKYLQALLQKGVAVLQGGGLIQPIIIKDGKFHNYKNVESGTYTRISKKSVIEDLQSRGVSQDIIDLVNQHASGKIGARKFVNAINSSASAPKRPSTNKPKDTGTTTAKVDGNVVTDGNLSVTIEDDSKLTAAEANKIVGYFSKLIESGEVAKAQCTRALKDLSAGTMTDQMKKRWLARIGASSLRPVPRKLVTLLREEQVKAGSQATGSKPSKKRKVIPTLTSLGLETLDDIDEIFGEVAVLLGRTGNYNRRKITIGRPAFYRTADENDEEDGGNEAGIDMKIGASKLYIHMHDKGIRIDALPYTSGIKKHVTSRTPLTTKRLIAALVKYIPEVDAQMTGKKPKPAAAKPASTAKPTRPKPSRKPKTTRKTKKLPHSILNSIEAAIEENGFDDVLGARVRGDLFEVYVLGNNQTVWSYNDKAKKAIDYTSPTTTGMYTNIDLGALAPIQQVNEIADLLHHLS